MSIFRTIIAGCLVLIAAHSVEESYETGVLGDLVNPEESWQLTLFGYEFPVVAGPKEPSYRLIGVRCGERKETVLAMEEDEFPICESITPLARRI